MRPPTISPTEFLFKELLDFYFGKLRRFDNYRPDWLQGLEIDRYYPDIKVGIEFQGIQHYRPTRQSQSSEEQFFDQLTRDTQKVQLAQKHGVRLFQIGLADISPERFKGNLKQIAQVGLRVAQANNDKVTSEILKSIRWEKEPDPRIFKRLEGIRRNPRWKVQSPKKKNLLRRILGI